MASSQVGELMRRVAALEKARKAAKRPVLSNSTIDGGAVQATDDYGNLTMVVGKQYDGTSTAAVVAGPTPPTPIVPFVTSQLAALRIYWDGTFEDGAVAPMDFARVVAHAVPLSSFVAPDPLDQASAVGQFTSATGGEITAGLDPDVEYAVYLVAWTQAGKYGASSGVATGTPIAAQASADGKNTIYYDPPPAGAVLVAGDTWFKNLQDGGVEIDVWDGSAWVSQSVSGVTLYPGSVTETQLKDSINTAISDAGTAATNAQAAASAAQTAANTAETDAQSAATAASNAKAAADNAQATATTAQTTANGKNKVTYSTAAPTNGTSAGVVGDIWFVRTAAGGLITAQYECTAENTWAVRTLDNAVIASLDAGKISTGYLAAARIAANTITATMIASDTITATQIAADAITSSELAASAVIAGKLAANSVIAASIQAGVIDASKMVAGTITAASGIIGNAAIGAAQIIDGSISTAKIGDAQITTAKIADASITSAKIGTLDASKITTGTLTGITITGVTIRNNAGLPRLEMSPATTVMYDVFSRQNVNAQTLTSYLGDGTTAYLDSYLTTDTTSGQTVHVMEMRTAGAGGQTMVNYVSGAPDGGAGGTTAFDASGHVTARSDVHTGGDVVLAGKHIMLQSNGVLLPGDPATSGVVSYVELQNGIVKVYGDLDHTPGVACYESGSAQSIPSSTYTTITAWLLNANATTAGALRGYLTYNGSGTWTVNKAGVYKISTGVEFASNATGLRYAKVVKNGVTQRRWVSSASSSGIAQVAGSCLISVNAGDTFVVQVYQNSGGNLAITADSNNGTYVDIVRMGFTTQ